MNVVFSGFSITSFLFYLKSLQRYILLPLARGVSFACFWDFACGVELTKKKAQRKVAPLKNSYLLSLSSLYFEK